MRQQAFNQSKFIDLRNISSFNDRVTSSQLLMMNSKEIKRHFLVIGLFAILFASPILGQSQIRFYLDYANIPFSKNSSNDFSVLTGIKLDPNKELVLGVGLRGRFNPENLNGGLKFSQSNFSLGFNLYYTRRLYFNTDVSLSLLNKVFDDVTNDPLDLDKGYYLDYKFNVVFVVMRRLHFATGLSLTDFSGLVSDVGQSVLQLDPSQVNLNFALRLYLFQIKL